MNTTLLNNHTKFRAKILKPYRVITFLVLGHFLAAPCRPIRSKNRVFGDPKILGVDAPSLEKLPQFFSFFQFGGPVIKLPR